MLTRGILGEPHDKADTQRGDPWQPRDKKGKCEEKVSQASGTLDGVNQSIDRLTEWHAQQYVHQRWRFRDPGKRSYDHQGGELAKEIIHLQGELSALTHNMASKLRMVLCNMVQQYDPGRE